MTQGEHDMGAGSAPRVAALQAQLAKQKVDAYVLPSRNPHESSYPPQYDSRFQFYTGLSSVGGMAVITSTACVCWPTRQLRSEEFERMHGFWTVLPKDGPPPKDGYLAWLLETLPEGSTVGIDPSLITLQQGRTLASALADSGLKLLLGGLQPAKVDGPPPKVVPLRVHDLQWAGRTVEAKLADLLTKMEAAGAGAVFIHARDEVAWLLNIRGGDEYCNPVAVSYAIVTVDSAVLYVDLRKVTADVQWHLAEAGVQAKELDALTADLAALAQTGLRFLLDPSQVSYSLALAVEKAAVKGPAERKGRRRGLWSLLGYQNGAAHDRPLIEQPSPIGRAKAIKNETEIAGMRAAHERDAVALAQTLAWLHGKVAVGGESVTEAELAAELTRRRQERGGFFGDSQPVIAGVGPNGAILDHVAGPSLITRGSLLLFDSGGQYECGTTDVTRTLQCGGEPRAEHREAYTRVLKGYIALETSVFPEGTPGAALDALARGPLWAAGMDYATGTGHGVGAALNIVEGNYGINRNFDAAQPLEAGMILSNEPGYYEPRAFGVRFENVMLVSEAAETRQAARGGRRFLRFKCLTLAPLEPSLIDEQLLNREELAWCDAYQARVRSRLLELLPQDDGATREWLVAKTCAISEQA